MFCYLKWILTEINSVKINKYIFFYILASFQGNMLIFVLEVLK